MAGAAFSSGRPSISIRSRVGSAESPRPARFPLTVTRPSATSCSARRREATPARAMTFWRRSLAIAGGGGLRRGRPGQRGELCRVGREWREVVERGEPEALEERERRGEQDRAPGRVPPADLRDQPAMEQRADDVVRVDPAHPLDIAPRAWL